MPADSSRWQLSQATWSQLCGELHPVTAASQPYERIRISPSRDGEGLSAFVEEPWPAAPTPPDDAIDDAGAVSPITWFDDAPTNESTTLRPGVADAIWSVLDHLQTAGFTIADDKISARLATSLFTPEQSVAVFALERPLSPNEAGLYTQFQDLMVTLGYGDDPDAIIHGTELAPRQDDRSPNTFDFGIGATAYRLVPDPHRYWADCDSLEEYIDMCVANGSDRASMEARELYYHHFHPTTSMRTLTSDEEAAVVAWHDALNSLFVPALSLGADVIDHYLSDAHIAEDGTGTVEYSVVVGDQLFDS